MEKSTETIRCPNCSAELPVMKGYVTWCDRCNWNLTGDRPQRKISLTQKMWLKVAALQRKLLIREAASNNQNLKDISLTEILAFLIALLVHLLTVFLAVFAIYILILNPLSWFAWCLSGSMLLFAWVVRPSLKSSPGIVLDQDHFPGLYRLQENIRKEVGSQPAGVTAGASFDAGIYYSGSNLKPLLVIGLPLWQVLSPEEKVAMLAAGMAQIRRKIFFMNWIVYDALETLDNWRGIGAFLAIIPLWLLQMLIIRDWQRRIYRADLAAARLVGTKVMVGYLKKYLYQDVVNTVAHRVNVSSREEVDVFEEIDKEIAQTPPRELERLSRVLRKEESETTRDGGEPRLFLRVANLENHPVEQSSFKIDTLLINKVNAEMRTLRPYLAERVMFNASRYYNYN